MMTIKPEEYNQNKLAFSYLEDVKRVTYVNVKITHISINRDIFTSTTPTITVKFSNGMFQRFEFHEFNRFASIFKADEDMDIGKGWSSDDFIGKYVRLCFSRDTVRFDFERFKKMHKTDEFHDIGLDIDNVYWKVSTDGGMFEFSDDCEIGNLIAIKFIVDSPNEFSMSNKHQNAYACIVGASDMTLPCEYEQFMLNGSKSVKKFNKKHKKAK